MIRLRAIKKVYAIEERKVNALKGISLDMRKAEFVCILGPSGCGKTTLLNIIGGLDRYTSGDLIIDGKSTKNFTEEDWDTYRSRKVGFVFQSYNLISHQTVLENVETALIISGISKEERRKRAIDALVEVGLSEHLRKTPRQLSGGEMQRVAIARAIVNNPQMILADEPTGALDSENSVKIMDLLKRISRNRLVITVTHNDDLANTYASRIIKMKDGEVVSDDNKFVAPVEKKEDNKSTKKVSFMSYRLATKLSFKNLLGKKVRTILTSFASSIAIVGIALVLACSNGINGFINQIQKETMSSVPIQVSTSDTNYAPMVNELFGYVSQTAKGQTENQKTDSIIINHTLKNMVAQEVSNEITETFINYINNNDNLDKDRVTFGSVKNLSKNIYKKIGLQLSKVSTHKSALNVMIYNATDWSCLPPQKSIVDEQYSLVYGKYPTSYNELVLVINKNSSISDTVLATYLIDIDPITDETKESYTYEEFLENKYLSEYFLVLNDEFYVDNGDGTFSTPQKVSLAKHICDYYRIGPSEGVIESEIRKKLPSPELYDKIFCYNTDPREETAYKEGKIEQLKIVGILRLNGDVQYGMLTSPIAYLPSLNDYIIENSSKSKITLAQKGNLQTSVLTGDKITDKAGENKALSLLGYAELPTVIKFYPKTIKDKDYLIKVLDKYNEKYDPDITYTDNVGVVIDLVRTVVGGVSAILIALTSISLFVSAIMIGIITYVSVIERTKEIGILRSVGARKKDVVRLFITETGIIGLVAGICGLILTLIVSIPINAVMSNLTGVSGFIFLKWWNFIALAIGSILLTVIAGLIPSFMASKKDPVKALRSE